MFPLVTQLLVVTTPGWDSPTGELRRYERKEAGWSPVGAPVPVVVGKNGLAWGLGLHPGAGTGPVKREGDGRAPAGAFTVGTGMGYGPLDTSWPWVVSTPGLRCVDDPQSVAYNQRVEDRPDRDWTSAERMVRDDGLYRHLLVVDHNPDAVPGAGSCIFLHVWRAAGKGTAGCTATDERALVEVIRWLDPAAKPVLVQLPQPVYTQVATLWGLPTP